MGEGWIFKEVVMWHIAFWKNKLSILPHIINKLKPNFSRCYKTQRKYCFYKFSLEGS